MNEQLQLIKEWLTDPSREYGQGLSLLTQVCRNKNLIRNLSKADNRYNQQKLQHELTKIAKFPSITTPTNNSAVSVPDLQSEIGQDDEKETIETSASAPSAEVSYAPAMTPEETKTAVEALEIALSRMHNKKGMLSNSLRDFAANDVEGRKVVLNEISALRISMNSIRGKLNYYQKNGVLPPLPVEKGFDIKENDIPDDPVLMKQMLLNERSNKAKLKKRIESPETKREKIPELEARFLSKSNLVAEIERRLNGSN